MEELSYGVEKPEADDPGSVWMAALENNCDWANDHDHDGSNSSLISAINIVKPSSSVTASGWTDLGGGNYSKLITAPASVTEVNNFGMFFIKTSDGSRFYPTVVRASATTFTVYLNEAFAFTILYS